MNSHLPVAITNECNTSSNNILSPDNQSTIILQQFSIMAEELKSFTKQVLSDIMKKTQAHNCVQEHTGKLIENAMSQALTKAQDTVVPSPTTVNTSIQDVNYASPSYESNWTSNWPTSHALCHKTHKLTDIKHIDTKRHQQIHNLIWLNNNFIKHPDFNQSVVEFLRHQMELAKCTQCLHQQTTDALHNITISSTLQENLHFIHDNPLFKAKEP